jgi:hypothetical protein
VTGTWPEKRAPAVPCGSGCGFGSGHACSHRRCITQLRRNTLGALRPPSCTRSREEERHQKAHPSALEPRSATTLLSDQQTEVTLRVNEMTAAVQLIQALGGGWDTSQLPSASAVTTQEVAKLD